MLLKIFIMAVYLQISSLTKSFGDLLLFSEISFGIDQGQKIGLIAKNGAGKTTLLNIIAGKEDEDSGEIVFRKELKVGYLQQDPVFLPDSTVLENFPKEKELQAKQILTRLKINDLSRKVGELSGGQLKRIALAQVLTLEPDLLILDEPTNHLDLEMTEWLEDYLSRSHITLLMVTHDRYFLDRVCNSILEIDNKQIYHYRGNYNYYLEKRQERIHTQSQDLERSNNLFSKELEWMRRQPQARATKAKARIDAFYELEEKIKQGRREGSVRLDVKASYIGNKIFEAKDVSKAYGPIKITENFNYVFARYEKMGIIGSNGTGKSSFVKMLMGKTEPDSGFFDIGETIRFGYYSQDGLQFDENMKVLDIVQDIAEVIDLGKDQKLTASQFLQHFLFAPEKQYDFVHKLSGGEKRRLYLCTVLMRNPNFLVLDEPTNDLDIVTLNILEEYLISFKGCSIVISHDRYFMDKVVDHLLVFNGQADIKDFPGNYSQYREWKSFKDKETAVPEVSMEKPAKTTPEFKPSKQKLTFNEKRELEALDVEIPSLEEEKRKLESELSTGTLSSEDLLIKSQRISTILHELEKKEMRWLELSEKNDLVKCP